MSFACVSRRRMRWTRLCFCTLAAAATRLVRCRTNEPRATKALDGDGACLLPLRLCASLPLCLDELAHERRRVRRWGIGQAERLAACQEPPATAAANHAEQVCDALLHPPAAAAVGKAEATEHSRRAELGKERCGSTSRSRSYLVIVPT